MNQDLIEKNYYEQLIVGHYIDAKYSEQEWKMGKLIDKDKKYAVIAFEGINSKQEQVYLNGHKVAPLRFHTEGYTGSIYRPHRPQPPPLNEYKYHLEILQQTYLKDPLPSAFTSTQYLRGDFFVLVHSLLTRQELKEEQYNEAMKFFLGFIQFVVKYAKKVKKISSQYFQSIGSNKYSYLFNDKVAYVNSLNQLLILLNLIIRAQNSKHVILFKSKSINQEALIKFFIDLKETNTFGQLFNLNDGNGKWLSCNIHKHLYFLLKKYSSKFVLPEYKIRDYQQVFSLYPFMIKQQQKQNNVEQKYIAFTVSCLKEQCSFETKLKAIQEIKKVIEGEVKLFKNQEKNIYSAISQQGVIDHMLSQYHFNPEIFKRFTAILQNYCKVKSLSMKNINNLIKYISPYIRLAKNRHQSEVAVIFEILCMLAEFVQVDALDFMYVQILKFPLNNEETIKLIKDFTINAISNYSKQKSFLSSLFKKTKNSSKYGFYGLDFMFKQLQDDGAIDKNHLSLGFQTVKEIFSVDIFEGERLNYLSTCIGWLQKIKNYGQSIKLIDIILATFPTSTFFSQTQKNLLDKLISKNNLLNLIIFGLKYKLKINQTKISLPDIIKHLYEFMQNYYDILIPYIKIEHIQFLWTLDENKLLSSFLKKSRVSDLKKKDYKQKHLKKIAENVQEQILTKLIRKKEFYERTLIIEEFEALDQIFVSYNLLKKKIDLTELGFMRYFTPEMEGYSFYFEFLNKLIDSTHIEKIMKKTILTFLRPKDEKDIETKANTWLMCLLKMVEKLKSNPEICLKAINLFFDMIQGKLVKLNVNFQGSIDIFVSIDNMEKKTITLPKNCTIFRLRKQIMEDFNISSDFTLYSTDMRRDVTFQEEEEYSLNALTNSSNMDKGPSLKIINKKKEKHPQMQAIDRFKEIIEKEEKFYSMLFELNNEKVHNIFWKTVELLPVNRQLIRKIENCANFTQKQWIKLLKSQTVESLQYHLNIIHEIMEKNSKWVAVFSSSGGLATIIELLAHKLKDEEIVIERIVNRCILIIVHVLDTVSKIEDELLLQLKLTLIAKIIFLFKADICSVTIGIDSLNNIFHLLKQINKIYKKQDTEIELEIMLKLLQYGIFKPKTKVTLEFIEKDFEHYLINHYSTEIEKISIYERLLSFLRVDFIKTKENSELMFVFLIDFMNTFVLQESDVVSKPEYLVMIQNFVMDVLTGEHSDPSKQKYSHLLLGAFKLLNFTLNYINHTYDQKLIFRILMKDFLFCKGPRRIKNEITLKALYESIKKILFSEQDLINVLIQEVAPRLRQNEWRKNMYTNWSIEAKRQERNIFCGLQNLGATCYINCLMQQLFMISHFRQNFLAIDSRNYRPVPAENQILQLQNIFSGLKYSNKRSINIKKFCDSFITYEGIPINPVVQSDADEFLNQLMEKIQAFLKENHRHDIMENTFEGKLSNQLNCEGCPHKSEKEDHFLSIGVNIRGKKTLEEALEGFVEGEILDGDNAYFCQLCQKKVRTQKRLCIKILPNILTIVIKRFEFNYDEMRKIKINSYLKFPLQLNMKRYTSEYLGGASDIPDEPYAYNLRGAVIHSGTSQGGHYYSFINSNTKWFSFNDEFIQEIKTSKIEEQGFGGEDKSIEGDFKFQKYRNAYILFYEKQNPSESYHEIQEEISTQFNKQMEKEVISDNTNADFLSVMLDSNFIRLSQNFSAIERTQAYQFSLLYFHTVVLRDRNKDQHIPNYYRILDSLLTKEEVSLWYLSQINHQFAKQFLIEGPRTTRFVCTSLILKALTVVKKIPKNFISHCILALKKNGMTPFAKIFKKLSESAETKAKLIEYQYPERVLNLLLDKTNENYNMIETESFESYFGVDSSEKQKERESCVSSLCQSLELFQLPFMETFQIFQKYASRVGSKALARVLALKVNQEQLSTMLISLESIILKDGEFKKEDLEKYLFLIRAVCFSAQEDTTEWKIQKCIYSLKKMVFECRSYYEPMQTLLREMNFIASRSKLFMKNWKTTVIEKENSYDMVKTLKFWLKEAERPQYLYKSEEFKRKVASLSYDEKNEIELKNKAVQERRVSWMVEKETNQPQSYDSEVEDAPLNKQVTIRNKRFKIKQHLGLIKKVEIDGSQRWGILQKNDFDLYHSL